MECQQQQEEIYHSVCGHLGSTGKTAPRLFPSLNALEYEGQKVKRRPISSEQDLETYERPAVEDHVRDIVNSARYLLLDMNFAWMMESGSTTMPIALIHRQTNHQDPGPPGLVSFAYIASTMALTLFAPQSNISLPTSYLLRVFATVLNL